jgi:hypothetical protein
MIRTITESLPVRKGEPKRAHNVPLRNCRQLPQYEKMEEKPVWAPSRMQFIHLALIAVLSIVARAG